MNQPEFISPRDLRQGVPNTPAPNAQGPSTQSRFAALENLEEEPLDLGQEIDEEAMALQQPDTAFPRIRTKETKNQSNLSQANERSYATTSRRARGGDYARQV
nr:hypothetical protein Itr_chr01CG08100 [Ipomoea trifida]